MALSCFCLAHVIPRKGDNPRFMSFHVLLLLHAAAVSLLCWGGVTSFFFFLTGSCIPLPATCGSPLGGGAC